MRPGELQEEGEGQQEGEEGELNKLHHNTQASSIPRPFSYNIDPSQPFNEKLEISWGQGSLRT